MTYPQQPQIPQYGAPPPPPQKSHTLRTVIIVLAVLFAVGLAGLVGCAALIGSMQTGTGPAPVTTESTESADAAGEEASEPPSPSTAKIGQWATADDGVEFRVSKLRRSAVSEIAAGGRPGNRAVAVTVQVKNGGSERLDLSALQVSVRLGKDGREAEEVFQDGYEGTPTGSLAPGRTSTSKYLFDAKSAAELKTVSVDVAPGFEYQSFTFEGGV